MSGSHRLFSLPGRKTVLKAVKFASVHVLAGCDDIFFIDEVKREGQKKDDSMMQQH